MGHLPRCLAVELLGENTRLAQPGDHVAISGVFLPALQPGFRQLAQVGTPEPNRNRTGAAPRTPPVPPWTAPMNGPTESPQWTALRSHPMAPRTAPKPPEPPPELLRSPQN